MSEPKPLSIRWFSRRAVVLHLLLLFEVPLCLLAGWWQANVALSGNTLSYFYAVEWPGFACVGFYTWWHLLHMPADEPIFTRAQTAGPDEAGEDETPAVPGYDVHWDPEHESPALRSYNAYLAEINFTGERTRWRPPSCRRWWQVMVR